MLTVKVRNGQVDKALKRFKRKVKDEGIIRDFRKHEFYQKPSEKRRAKRKRRKNNS